MAIDDEPSAHAWADITIQRPRQCLQLHGGEDHFVVTGEFVMFRQPVAHKMLFGGNERVLHATVGRFLRLEQNVMG